MPTEAYAHGGLCPMPSSHMRVRKAIHIIALAKIASNLEIICVASAVSRYIKDLVISLLSFISCPVKSPLSGL